MHVRGLIHNRIIKTKEQKVREILDFFKDIFMIKEDKTRIGLSQFRVQKKAELQQTVAIVKKNKELKLSDLMRGTVN